MTWAHQTLLLLLLLLHWTLPGEYRCHSMHLTPSPALAVVVASFLFVVPFFL